MSILSHVSHSTAKTGMRVVIAGVEKVGKTTLSCSAPRALLVPLEQGYSGVKVNKTPMLQQFNDVMQLLTEVQQNAHAGQFPYQSLVFDSATALERLIHLAVLATDPLFANGNKKGLIMDNALGGYGKAYNLANERFGEFLKQCDVLAVYYGINIVLTSHVFAAKIIDPTAGEYDSWDLLLHSPKNQKTYGKREMITQWADVVGFLHEPIFVTKGTTLSQGVSAKKGHIMGVSRTPGYVAGNRYGMTEEITIPRENGWNYLAHAIYTASGIDIYNRDV